MKRVVSTILLVILLTSMLYSAFKIMPAEAAGTIYIRADGSIDPPTAPIQRNGNLYTLTASITSTADGIVIERNNTTLDGAGYTVQPTGAYVSKGISVSGRSNVTIKSMTIKAFYYGISLDYYSDYNSISGNNITNNYYGIVLDSSSNNSISGNNVTANNEYGILLGSSSDYNSISGNTFANDGLFVQYSYQNSVENNTVNGRPLVYLEGVSNYTVDDAGQVILVRCENITVEGLNLSRTTIGVELWETINSTISGNNITANNVYGILLWSSSDSTISGNNITANNEYGIWLQYSSGNKLFHNSFVNNNIQVYSSDSVNVWDDGYPSGGNYWSDYTGVDADGDGIGDTPHILDAQNVDNYPLMQPFNKIQIPGDINTDGIVDIFDIVIVALEFGHPPPPIVDLRADVNKDGLVDIFDIVVVALHFGETG